MLDVLATIAEERRSSIDDEHKSRWGQFFTPPTVASFMGSLIDVQAERSEVIVLDPGAGTGILGIAAARALLEAGAPAVHLLAVEADPSVLPHLERSLDLARTELGARFRATLRAADFLSLAQHRLGVEPLPAVDVVIANPPYFKMSPTEEHGGTAPNAYARFMEVAAGALRAGGQFVFIVPRSFASGFYFQRFRRRLHDQLSLARVHVFDSRRDAFREDDVLQENIIVVYRKASSTPSVLISSSTGLTDLDRPRRFVARRDQVLRPKDPHGVVYLPASDEDDETMRTVLAWPGSLHALGLEISTGPVVPFRATGELTREGGTNTVPMLWMQHVRHGVVRWPIPNFRKPQHILDSAGDKLLVPNRTYILLRRFSAKEEPRRLTVAVLRGGVLPGGWVGLENHLNFIHRPRGILDDELAIGLATLLGSTLLDSFFRIQSGNTQVSATELRALPLPSEQVLRELGRAMNPHEGALADQERVDALVDAMARPKARSLTHRGPHPEAAFVAG